MTTIDRLDDLSLLVIFDKLSIEHLLVAGRVCRKWHFIRAKSAKSRNSLKLLVGNVESAEKTIIQTRFLYIPTKRHLFGEDGEELKVLEENAIQKNYLLQIDGSLNESGARILANLFPNVEDLIVSVCAEPKDINPLIVLLKALSPKLHTLKLYTYNQDLNNPNRNVDIPTNKKLLSTLNSLSTLRVLHFDFKSSLLLHAGDQIEFSILSQLEQFCFSSDDGVDLDDFLLDSLNKYAAENAGLKKIALPSNFDEPEKLLGIPVEVACSFTQIQFHVNAFELNAFHKFCLHFSQLTILIIALHQTRNERLDPFKLYNSIAQLKQLESLEIGTEDAIWEQLCFNNETEIELNAQIDKLQSVSVKALSLFLFTSRLSNHNVTESFYFERIFPKLEILKFNHEKLLCNHCKDNQVNETDFLANCRRPMLFPFYKCANIQAITSPPIASVLFLENTKKVDEDEEDEEEGDNEGGDEEEGDANPNIEEFVEVKVGVVASDVGEEAI